jgi:hypothetical protein
VNRDFRDLLAEFNGQGVEFLVVGAHALAAHGHVRATKDLDVWVRPDPANAARILKALQAFGAPLHDLTEQDLSSARFQTRFADQPAAVLSREHLILNKRASGRTQDLADIEWLEGGGA